MAGGCPQIPMFPFSEKKVVEFTFSYFIKQWFNLKNQCSFYIPVPVKDDEVLIFIYTKRHQDNLYSESKIRNNLFGGITFQLISISESSIVREVLGVPVTPSL